MAVDPGEIAFSEAQQSALLGYAVTDERVFDAATGFGVSKTWFYNANCQSVWGALQSFHELMHKHPSMDELQAMSAFVDEEAKVKTARTKALGDAIAGMSNVGFDTIVIRLREWSKAQRFREGMEKAAQFYMKGDTKSAYKVADDTGLALQRIDQQGFSVRYQTAPIRAAHERGARLAQIGHTLKYGVTYLDEAAGGIGPKEFVLVGAKTGVGKTQLVTRIAAVNASQGKRVALFALEAEEDEIERRIKYGLLARAYRASVRVPKPIDYLSWYQGRLEAELGPFEDGVLKAMTAAYSSLSTMYRLGGDYGINELERDIVRVSSQVDLIIVDHFHYVDLDGDNENAAMKALIKKCRDLVIGLGKPIIGVAHLKKTMRGKSAPLMPDIEDFHGSSDLIKIPTTSIMLAPCYSVNWNDPKRTQFVDTWPTFIKLNKSRLDGSRTRFTGISMFDPGLGTYRKEYGIGHLTAGDTHWEPVTQSTNPKKPYWAENGTLLLGSIE